MSDPVKIFISYAKEDDKHRIEIKKHLKTLTSNNKAIIWDTTSILSGNIEEQTEREISAANVALLLLSVDFTNSEANIAEMNQFIRRFKKDGIVIVPILLRSCVWDFPDIKKLKPLPSDEQAIEAWKNPEDAYANVANGITNIINNIISAKELNKSEINSPDPAALCICVQNEENVTIFAPNQAGQSFAPAKAPFHSKVAGILQRLMVDSDLEADDFTILGEALYHRLLSESARAYFEKVYLEAEKGKNADNCLKIILFFDEKSRDLAALPWEYLYVPFLNGGKEDGFLGVKDNLILTRRLSDQATPGPIQPKRALILSVVPKSNVAEAIKKVKDDADATFKRLQLWESSHPWLHFEKAEVKTVKELKEAIAGQANPFNVVHYFGGSLAQSSKNLDKPNALLDLPVEDLTPDEFLACFGKKPDLLFLHTVGGSSLSLRKMALELVKNVDGILAIQLPAGSDEVASYAEDFYKTLVKSRDFDSAAATIAREWAKKTTTMLKRYGISASYSKQGFKMEVGGENPLQLSDDVFYTCYNPQCRKLVSFNVRKITYCENPLCEQYGPMWPCPFCQMDADLEPRDKSILADLSKTKCQNGHIIRRNGRLVEEFSKVTLKVRDIADQNYQASIASLAPANDINTVATGRLGGLGINTGNIAHESPGEARREAPKEK
jgi:hypothetical protein